MNKITIPEPYTINGKLVKEIAVRLASHLLTLPTGSWPETQQAEKDLDAALPRNGVTRDDVLRFCARRSMDVHRSRLPWLRSLAAKYSVADVDSGRVFPALANPSSPYYRP